MASTGNPYTDALTSIKNQLENKKSAWKISHIYDYPAYAATGAFINSICLELMPETQITAEQFAAPDIQYDYRIAIKLSYLCPNMAHDKQYKKSLNMLTNIQRYLLQNQSPDNFGSLIAVGNMQLGDIPTAMEAGEKVFVASLEMELLVQETITMV